MKVVDRVSGEQIFPVNYDAGLDVPTGKQKVSVNSLHAFDNEFAYFTWAQFGEQSQDVMMLLDTGASISILPRTFWEELCDTRKTTPQPSQVEIEVGNGGHLDTDGTVRLNFSLSDYEFEHVFFHLQGQCNSDSGERFHREQSYSTFHGRGVDDV